MTSNNQRLNSWFWFRELPKERTQTVVFVAVTVRCRSRNSVARLHSLIDSPLSVSEARSGHCQMKFLKPQTTSTYLSHLAGLSDGVGSLAGSPGLRLPPLRSSRDFLVVGDHLPKPTKYFSILRETQRFNVMSNTVFVAAERERERCPDRQTETTHKAAS